MLAPSPRADAQFERDLVAALPGLRRQLRKLCPGYSWVIDDLVQHACERALARHTQFERGTNMGGWLFTIAQYKFFEDRRRVIKWEVEDIDGYYSLSLSVDAPQRRHVEAKDALRLLPDIYRQAVSMHTAGYEYHEIAELDGVAIGTVKSRINRGRGLLRRQFEADGASQ